MYWFQKHGPLGMGEFGLAVHRFLYNYLSQDIKICFPASWTTLTIQQYFCVEELLMCWTKSTTMGDQWKSESNRLLVLSFPGSMQRMAHSLYHFHRYFFWPDVLDGLKEMFTRTQFVCDQGGYFPEIKVDISSWTRTCDMSCNSFLKSGTSWEIHHEATSRVPWLAEDAATEREVLVRDNRWKAESCFSERHDD